MDARRIKQLRESKNLTQSDLAKKLNITRSAVNSWEMEISTPTAQNLVEMSKIFNVSVDYLLGLDKDNVIDVTGLGDKELKLVYELIERLKQ